ncbi:MAG: restriction endonuclease subunit S [Thermodesulfobacteriota bacterium]
MTDKVQQTSLKPLNPVTLEPLKEGWRWLKLREVCSVHPGQHILEADYNRKGIGIGYLTGPDDFGKESPNVTKWTEKSKAWCEPSDVLVTVKGAGVGKTNLAPNERVAIGRQLMAVRPNPGQIDHIFLYHVLITCFSKLQGSALGSTVPGLGRGNIESLEFPCPPLLEQKRIATKIQEFMQEVDRGRTACEKQLEAAKALPSAHLRAVFESEESKKWENRRLGEVCEIVTGSTPKTDDPSNWNGEILWATPNDMGKLREFTIEDTERKISQKGFESCSTKLLPPESVLLTTRAPIGHLAINLKPMCTNQGFKSLIPTSKIYNWFLFFALKHFVPVLQSMGRGQTFTEISKGQVETFEIPIPHHTEQYKIATYLKEKMAQVENLQSAIRNQLSALNTLPQAILRQAFNGEL